MAAQHASITSCVIFLNRPTPKIHPTALRAGDSRLTCWIVRVHLSVDSFPNLHSMNRHVEGGLKTQSHVGAFDFEHGDHELAIHSTRPTHHHRFLTSP